MARAGLLAILLAASSGCALVLNRGAIRQPLHVDSDPQGAVATLEGGASCETPCELPAPRSRDAVVTISKEDREPVAAVFRSRLGERTLLNLLLPFPGVVIGFATDVATGAAYDLVPPAAAVALRPAPPPESGEAPRPPPEPRVLDPRRPVRLALTVGLGAGGTAVSGGGALLQGSAVATFRVSDRWVVGAAADKGLEPPLLWEEPTAVSTWAVVGGMEAAPTRNSRLVALLEAGSHRYSGTREVTLPAIGLRVDWAAVFADGFTLGLYSSYLRDLGTGTVSSDPFDPVEAGGDTFVVGFALGALVRGR